MEYHVSLGLQGLREIKSFGWRHSTAQEESLTLWGHHIFMVCSEYDSNFSHSNTLVLRGPPDLWVQVGFPVPGSSLLLVLEPLS